MPHTPQLDFVGGWSADRYAEAQARLEEYERRFPYSLPKWSLREMKSEFYELRVALDRLGLSDDLMKLFTIGVRKRRMLAVVGPAEVEMLGLAGTPAQYRSVWASALEEYEFASPECELPGICAEELRERLLGVQLYQEMVAAGPRAKKARRAREGAETRPESEAEATRAASEAEATRPASEAEATPPYAVGV